MNFLRTHQSFIFKFVISASLISFLIFFSEPAKILESIHNVDLTAYLLAVVIYLVAQVINARKWHLLLPEVEFLSLLKFTFIGAFYTLILPGQLSGEVAKTWRLARGTSIAEQVVASVFVDRVTGIIALLLLAVIGASFSTSDAAGFVILPSTLLLVLLFFSVFLMRIRVIQEFSQALVKRMMEPVPMLRNQQTKVLVLLDHLVFFSNAHKKMMVSIFIGFIFQVAVVAIALILARALEIDIGFWDLSWIMGLISLMVFLPITISGIGVRELGFVGILSLFGIDVSIALTLSLLIFSLQVFGAALGAGFELTTRGKP